MIFVNLAKAGSLIVSGVIVGTLLPYNSKKVEIIDGIANMKNIAIDAKEELGATKGEVALLEKENKELLDKNNKLVKENEKLVKENDELYAAGQQLLKEKAYYHQHLVLANKEIAKGTNIVNDANRIINQANNEQIDILDEINKAQEEIENATITK